MKRANKTYTINFVGDDIVYYTVNVSSNKEPKILVNLVLKSKIYGRAISVPKMKVRRIYLEELEKTNPYYYWQVIDNTNGREYYYV